jgi:hypothetical protein
MFFANGRRMQLDLETALPRKDSQGIVEILTLNLPKEIELLNENKGKLTRKIFGFNLRSGYLPGKYEKNAAFRVVRNLISVFALSMLLKQRFKLTVSRNLGNDSFLGMGKTNEILVGYFQTHMVAAEVLKIKESIFLEVGDEEFVHYRLLAQTESPLLVHVRLGDYQLENQFGILSDVYYQSAIESQWATGQYKKIWLFSDQPLDALEKIPEEFRNTIRILQTDHMESAEILRVMTLCKGFVIANSTFSWWGAFLREDQAGLVIAPQPWFIALPEPSKLIPDDWQRKSGFN